MYFDILIESWQRTIALILFSYGTTLIATELHFPRDGLQIPKFNTALSITIDIVLRLERKYPLPALDCIGGDIFDGVEDLEKN